MEENIRPPQSSLLDNNNNNNDNIDDVTRAHPCLLLMSSSSTSSSSSSQTSAGAEQESKNLTPLRRIYEDHILPRVVKNSFAAANDDVAPHLVQFTKSILRQLFDAAFFCQVVVLGRATGRHHQCLDEEVFKSLTMDNCFIDLETGFVKLKLSRSNRCHEMNTPTQQAATATTTTTVVQRIAKIGYQLLTGTNDVDDSSNYSSQHIPERLRDPFLILILELCLISQNDNDDQNDNNYPRPAPPPTPTLGFIVSLMYFSGSCVVHQHHQQQYDISKTTFFNRLSLKKFPINIKEHDRNNNNNNNDTYFYDYDAWSTDVAQLSQGYRYLLSSQQDSDQKQKCNNDHDQNMINNTTNKTPQEIVKEQLFFFCPGKTSSSSSSSASSSLLEDPCHWGDQIYKELLLAGNAVFERTTTGKFLRYIQQQQKQKEQQQQKEIDNTIHNDDDEQDDPDFFITAANEEISTRDEYLRNLCILLTSEHDYMSKQLSMMMMSDDVIVIIINRRREIYEGRLGLACMNLAKAVAYFFNRRTT